jgi:uncharacterized cupredoxin-like copper-binding protein
MTAMRRIIILAVFGVFIVASGLIATSRWSAGAQEATPPADLRCPSPLASPVASPTGDFAPSPEASPTAEPLCVAVIEGDYFVHAERTTFQVGQAYIFAVANQGSEIHEFVIERAGSVDEPLEVNGREVELEDIAPGQTAELEFTFTEPGRYQLACHIPGHFENGMVLEIEVTG